jgi:molecular chaperone GrpE (heat shock protein)
MQPWEIGFGALCVVIGATLAVTPYIMEYRALVKYGALNRLIATSALCTATEKIQNLEALVSQITSATDQWQTAQTQADKTTDAAKEISSRMTEELKDFTAFMQKAGEGEKATLRLETEKLRRAENEWLNVTVFILDHIFALNRAAERSGQQTLINQLCHFQNACRDAARRVGLVPVLAEANEAFDSQRHQTPEGAKPEDGSVVAEVMATGFSFQGRVLRPVVVRVNTERAGNLSEAVATAGQSHLPLETAESPPA